MKNVLSTVTKLIHKINNLDQEFCQKYVMEEYKDKAFTRSRNMVFSDFVQFQLNNLGLSTTIGLENFYSEVKPEFKAVTKENYSKRRKALNPLIYIDLNKELLEGLKVSYAKKAADGSLLELPGTKILRQEFEYDSGKDTNTTRCLVELIIDVETKLILGATINNYRIGERELLNNLLSEIVERGTIILDRGYFGIEQFLKFELLEEKYIARIPKNTFKQERKALKSDDEIFYLKKSRLKRVKDLNVRDEFLSKNDELKIRMIRSKVDDFEERIILTNDFEKSKEEIEYDYTTRWSVERVIESLKNKHKIESIGGRSRIAIEQEFYASILIYNISTALMYLANEEIAEEEKEVKETQTINKKKLIAQQIVEAIKG